MDGANEVGCLLCGQGDWICFRGFDSSYYIENCVRIKHDLLLYQTPVRTPANAMTKGSALGIN